MMGRAFCRAQGYRPWVLPLTVRTRMATRFQILGLLNIYIGSILDQLGTFYIGAWRLILPVQLRFTGLRPILHASLLKGLCSHTASD
jgi:hypothetical protein